MFKRSTKYDKYTIKDGFVIKDELNETLDFAIVSFVVKGDLPED